MKRYIQLIKPGYIVANCFTALAGFFLASRGHISSLLLLATIAAISFGMASACVINNYIDKNIDGKMDRTKNRSLVTGDISIRSALTFAVVLGVISIFLFIIFTNLLTLFVGAVGIFFYLVLYSISKRKTSWSTVIGSVPGAVVPVAGYTAVTGRIDLGAILLFFILAFWQMPHFYAIAIYRRKEYENANLPILSVAKGITETKIHILFYVIAFTVVALFLSITGYTGKAYFFVMFIMSFTWIIYAISGFFNKNANLWAKKMFFFSLIINVVLCTMILVSSINYAW